MKKVVLALLIALLAVPAFAAEGQIGVSIAPEWFWLSSVEGAKPEESVGESTLYLSVDGANYFGEDGGGFGIEYGLGVSLPLYGWAGKESQRIEGDAGFIFRAGLGFRREFNDLTGLAIGFGVNGSYSGHIFDLAIASADFSALMLSIYGRVAVDLTFLDCLRLDLGIAMGGPIFTSVKAVDKSQSVDISGSFLAPFAAISYVY